MPDIPLPLTAATVYRMALVTQAAWIEAATAANAPAAYLAGLARRDTVIYPLDDDALAAAIVNRAPNAARVDDGTPPVHLPEVYRWPTPKTRRNRQGGMYLVIPMRHATRAMPRRIYAVARQLESGQRLTAGASQGRAVHAPGLTPYQPRLLGNLRSVEQASIYEGMRRMPGRGGRGSSYVTFRTLRPDSPGWWLPARPGLHLDREVTRQMEPQIQFAIEQALAQDVENILRQRLGAL